MVCPYNKTSYPASRRAPTRSSSYLGGESGTTSWLDNATWSPDGSRVAARQVGGYSVDAMVLVMARDGTDLRILAEGDDRTLHAFNPPQPETPIDIAACSAGLVVPEPETNSGLVEDCKTLLGVRDTLGGRLRWTTDTSIAEWSGVVVSGHPPRVRELVLSKGGLRGVVSPDLGKLTMLEKLDLSHNKLTGRIPSELNGLTNLKELYLRWNYLSSGIPPELADMKALRVLDLARNNLRGVIPPELGGLENLSSLDLGRNILTGSIPAELSGMTGLTFLHLWENDLSGCVPTELPDRWVYASGLERCKPEGKVGS